MVLISICWFVFKSVKGVERLRCLKIKKCGSFCDFYEYRYVKMV